MSALPEPWISYYNCLKYYKTVFGFIPNTIIDIGAASGHFSQTLNYLYPISNYLLVESDERFIPELQKTNLPFEIAHLHYIDNKELTIYKCCNTNDYGVTNTIENNPFLLEQNRIEETHTISITLDTLLKKRNINPKDIHLIKLDVQGAELDVLKGSTFIKEYKPWIIMEVSYVQYNQKQPLFNEVVMFMDSLGYKTAEVIYLHYQNLKNNRVPVQCDMLFVPKSHVDEYQIMENKIKESQLLESIQKRHMG
jgi:FkbM family methyltransferase